MLRSSNGGLGGSKWCHGGWWGLGSSLILSLCSYVLLLESRKKNALEREKYLEREKAVFVVELED